MRKEAGAATASYWEKFGFEMGVSSGIRLALLEVIALAGLHKFDNEELDLLSVIEKDEEIPTLQAITRAVLWAETIDELV